MMCMKKKIPILLVLLLWTGCLFSCNPAVNSPGVETTDRYTEATAGTAAEPLGTEPPETEPPESDRETTLTTEETSPEETTPATEPITEPITAPVTDPVTEPESESATEPETTEAHVHEYDPDGATYELSGDSCTEGVRKISRCTLCGEETVQILHEHIPSMTERVNLADQGYCGGYLLSEACLCGEYRNYSWNLFCPYVTESGSYTDEAGHTVETITYDCPDCAKSLRYRYYRTAVQDTCEVVVQAAFDRLAEGRETELMVCQRNWYDHVYRYTWEEGITSCEDGVNVSRVCQYCGHEDGAETITEHTYYETSRYEWADYGLCGGYLSVLSCPCGQYENYDWQLTCAHTTEEGARTDEAGHEVSVLTNTCATCRRSLRYTAYAAPADTACGMARIGAFEVLDEGEVIFSVNARHNWEEHIYVYAWDGEVSSCTEGVTVSSVCTRCGDRQDPRILEDHEPLLIAHHDLAAEGFCGGFLERYACPCGEMEDYAVSIACMCTPDSVSYVDADGREVTEDTYTCGDCGHTLTYTRTAESAKDSCEVSVRASMTWHEGESIRELTARSAWRDHQYVRSWGEGITSCLEGVCIGYDCLYCGERYEVTFRDHVTFETELYDLADFGLCGGFLSLMACPCGTCHEYDWGVVCRYVAEESEYLDDLGRRVHLTRYSCADCGGELRYSYTKEQQGPAGGTVIRAVFEIVVDQVVTKTISCLKSGGDSGYMM